MIKRQQQRSLLFRKWEAYDVFPFLFVSKPSFLVIASTFVSILFCRPEEFSEKKNKRSKIHRRGRFSGIHHSILNLPSRCYLCEDLEVHIKMGVISNNQSGDKNGIIRSVHKKYLRLHSYSLHSVWIQMTKNLGIYDVDQAFDKQILLSRHFELEKWENQITDNLSVIFW